MMMMVYCSASSFKSIQKGAYCDNLPKITQSYYEILMKSMKHTNDGWAIISSWLCS